MRNSRTVWNLTFVLAVVAICSAARPVWAATSIVKDGANFFSADAVQKANAALESLQQQYHHTVIVETLETAPAEIQGHTGDAAGRDRAYNDYSDVRLSSLGADVYLFATKSPGHLVIRARNDQNRSGLTETGRLGLTSDMLASFKAHQFDEALAKLTDNLQTTYARAGNGAPAERGPSASPPANQPQALPPSRPVQRPASTGLGFGSIGCIGLLVILFIVFIVIRLIRRLIGGGNQTPPPGYGGGYGQNPGGYGSGGYGGGGGGFGRGIFGGLLGGLFGSYLGNRTFGQGPQNSGGGLFGGGGGGNDSGSSASGGDFGNAPPSGGDVGGGGGDFGGGGGGGDSGSSASGGDF